jgi:uncharacterized protein (DUF4415 family)
MTGAGGIPVPVVPVVPFCWSSSVALPYTRATSDHPVRRSGGPQHAPTKQATSIRLDADILRYYRAGGRGWQTRLNADLRALVRARRRRR